MVFTHTKILIHCISGGYNFIHPPRSRKPISGLNTSRQFVQEKGLWCTNRERTWPIAPQYLHRAIFASFFAFDSVFLPQKQFLPCFLHRGQGGGFLMCEKRREKCVRGRFAPDVTHWDTSERRQAAALREPVPPSALLAEAPPPHQPLRLPAYRFRSATSRPPPSR